MSFEQKIERGPVRFEPQFAGKIGRESIHVIEQRDASLGAGGGIPALIYWQMSKQSCMQPGELRPVYFRWMDFESDSWKWQTHGMIWKYFNIFSADFLLRRIAKQVQSLTKH